MLAAAVALLDSAVAVVAVLHEAAVRAERLLVPRRLVVADRRVGPEVRLLAQVPPQPLLLHLRPLRLPQVVVESEVILHLKGPPS